ncbi:MAG TPA: hypothetical protein VEA63_07575 [Opitutus sp.]|nr:hypothetical protein [Opitutus sp.]
MNRLTPAVLLSFVVAGCTTKAVKTTEVHRPTTSTIAYAAFVERRTDELQRMGGPFADRNIAATKARELGRSLYGEPTPDVSTTWSWGSEARRKEAQADVTETLDKWDRNESRH